MNAGHLGEKISLSVAFPGAEVKLLLDIGPRVGQVDQFLLSLLGGRLTANDRRVAPSFDGSACG